MSCKRSQEFLAKNGVAIAETTIANRVRFDAEGALTLARAATAIWIAKGKKVERFDASTADDALLRRLLGPSGKLRAPALRRGDLLVVGFNEGLYAEAFDLPAP